MTFINLTPACSEAVAWLQAHPLTGGLPHAALAQISVQAELRAHPAGAVLFCEGDAARHWLGVASGCVEMVRFGSSGDERVFHCFGSGQCLAEEAMFMAHGRYPMQARAALASRLWWFPRSALHQTCETHPALALRLLQTLGLRLYQHINQIEWLGMSSAAQRLAAVLLQLSQQQGHALQIPCSQRQLAGQLGIRPETLSRLLANWQQRRWVEGQRRCWRLLDVAPLQRLASAGVRAF